MVTEKRSKHRQELGRVELSSLSVGKSREGMEMSQPGCVQQEALGLLESTKHV